MLVKEYKVNETFIEQNPTDMDSINDGDYMIQDVKGYPFIELSKTLGHYEILIQFKARPYQDIESETEDIEQPEQNMKPKDIMDYVYFTVFITKNNESIAYECITVDGELMVNHVVSLDRNMQDYKSQTRIERDHYQYIGPQFDSLDDLLQKALIDYLKQLGVNHHLCQFIHQYSIEKDSKLYLEWIKSLLVFMK